MSAPEKSLVEAVSEAMRAHVGEHGTPIGEGGCPRIYWYRFKKELSDAIEAWNRRPEPFAPSPAGVEVVAWQWRKKPWAGSADGSAKWSDWQNGRAADAAKFEPADYEERALVPAASLASLQSENQALREEVERLTKERDEARRGDHAEFEHEPTWNELTGTWKARAEVAESQVQSLTLKLEERDKALEPSAETKAAYIGEFHFNVADIDNDSGEECTRRVQVPWATIKEIMAAIRARVIQSGEEV